ncbi:MAG: hypothetical protein ACLFVL_06130 [Candidatus Aenigmatarchaeota archaeon]
MAIEGDLSSNDYIFDVVRYDPETGGFEERFFYYSFTGEWVGDFVIQPGDGIALGVENSFTWQVELITPYRGGDSNQSTTVEENQISTTTTTYEDGQTSLYSDPDLGLQASTKSIEAKSEEKIADCDNDNKEKV